MTSRKSSEKFADTINLVDSDLESLPTTNNNAENNDEVIKKKKPIITDNSSSFLSSIDGKKLVAIVMFLTIAILLWDALLRPPQERLLKPDAAKEFLEWVEANPYWGLGAFLVVIAGCVVLMLPVGTPLTLGCGFIYKGVYGWRLGVTVATIVSMAGSALGAVICFLLGRYMMRDSVRKWARKYPLFDAIDMGKWHVTQHTRLVLLVDSKILCCKQLYPNMGFVSWQCYT